MRKESWKPVHHSSLKQNSFCNNSEIMIQIIAVFGEIFSKCTCTCNAFVVHLYLDSSGLLRLKLCMYWGRGTVQGFQYFSSVPVLH